jgi:signal peptidase I
MSDRKLRNPVVALVLSILTVGLGHLYSTRHKRALLFYGGFLALWFLCLYTPLTYSYLGVLIASIAFLSFFVFQAADAWRVARRVGVACLQPYNRRIVYVLIVVLHQAVLVPILSWALPRPVKSYRNPTRGMEPSLMMGDYFTVDRFRYRKEGPKRGDVIVFAFQTDPRKDFVKRVIGLPGEKVGTVGSKILINDVPLDDPWGMYTGPSTLPDYGPIKVPLEEYFVLGDNRNNSADSRVHGLVKRSSIRGKALYVYWARDIGRVGEAVR